MRYLPLLLLLTGCFVIENQYEGIAPGPWRAELALVPKSRAAIKENPRKPDDNLERQMLDIKDGTLPFVFEVQKSADGKNVIDIINGDEKIRVDNVQFGHDRSTGRDTLVIDFPLYDSYIKANIDEKLINGVWVVKTRNNYEIPFSARFGQNHRFTQIDEKPNANLSGKWEVTFGLEEDEPYPAIGEFLQKGNILTGTFVTETGDYRYLEGTVQGDKFYLSTFDGAHAFLFSGKILKDNSLIGSFRSGSHYRTTWKAVKNSDAVLTSPDSLTYLLPGYDAVEFSFPNTEGKMVSLNDPTYEGKAKIIQIFGTWCPNCRDETEFLKDYLSNNNTDDLEIIALAFEKYRDPKKSIATISKYKNHFKLPYEMLSAGYYNKAEAQKSLPMLNAIISYPTMIFLDKKNQVRKIHTGFSGPATSQFEDFKKDFKKTVELITK